MHAGTPCFNPLLKSGKFKVQLFDDTNKLVGRGAYEGLYCDPSGVHKQIEQHFDKQMQAGFGQALKGSQHQPVLKNNNQTCAEEAFGRYLEPLIINGPVQVRLSQWLRLCEASTIFDSY